MKIEQFASMRASSVYGMNAKETWKVKEKILIWKRNTTKKPQNEQNDVRTHVRDACRFFSKVFIKFMKWKKKKQKLKITKKIQILKISVFFLILFARMRASRVYVMNAKQTSKGIFIWGKSTKKNQKMNKMTCAPTCAMRADFPRRYVSCFFNEKIQKMKKKWGKNIQKKAKFGKNPKCVSNEKN